jgi:hypothetical protein
VKELSFMGGLSAQCKKHRETADSLTYLGDGGDFLVKMGKEKGDMWIMKRGAKLQLTMVACADIYIFF